MFVFFTRININIVGQTLNSLVTHAYFSAPERESVYRKWFGYTLVHTRGRYLALAATGVRDAEILDALDDSTWVTVLTLRRRRCYVRSARQQQVREGEGNVVNKGNGSVWRC